MDYQTFIQQLPSLYSSWGQPSVRPQSPQFQTVLQHIQGMTTANVLQLLNFAVGCMEPGEVYCEVGCFQGSTLTGALLNHPDRMAYAVDNFSEFDVTGENQARLMQNLSHFGLHDQVFFCNQDFEAFFADLRSIETSDRIGVYFYDGAHDYRSQLMGLLLAKPFLADRALIVVDDSNWAPVQQANWDFIAAHPQCRMLLDLPTPINGDPTFWNGLQVLSWDVRATEPYNWSTLQQVRQSNFIRSIYDLAAVDSSSPALLDRQQADAVRLRETGQLVDAAAMLAAIVQQDDQRADTWHELATVYYLMDRWDDAYKALSKAIAINPALADYHYSLGLLLTQMGDIAAAAQAYQQSIVLAPTLIDAHNNLGNLVLEHGDAHQAESIFRQAITFNSDDVGTYLNLGNALLAQGNVDGAIATYQTALQQRPAHEAVLNNLDFAYRLRQDPAQLALYCGNRFYRQQKYQQALQHYQTLVETPGGDVAFYHALADCYRNTDQLDAAIAACDQGLERHPNEPSLHLAMISDLHSAGRLQEAIAAATTAIARFPDNIAIKLENQRLLPLIYQTPADISVYRQRYTQVLHHLVHHTPLVTAEHYQTAIDGIGRGTNFLLSYQGENDLDLQKQYGKFVHQVMAAAYPQ